jgi:hypothetical protein
MEKPWIVGKLKVEIDKGLITEHLFNIEGNGKL